MILSLSQNTHFRPKHIPCIVYTAANLLSRLKIQEFLTRLPHMDKELTHVPQFIIDLNQTADVLVRNFLSQTTASANQ